MIRKEKSVSIREIPAKKKKLTDLQGQIPLPGIKDTPQ